MKHVASSIRRTQSHLHTLTGRADHVLLGRAAAGIWAALGAWGIREQVVVLPANTCYIVLWAVLKSGNRPLLVDVDPSTANLSIHNLNTILPFAPAVVIPCHMYGLSAPMQAICEWGKQHNVKVIEDAALALGATVDGQPAGSWGDASLFSFGLGKIADNQVGGALLTSDTAFAREAQRLLANTPLWDDRLMSLTNQWNSIYWPLHQYEAENPRLLGLYPQLFDIYGDLTVYRLAASDWDDMPKLLRHLPENIAHRSSLTAVYDTELVIARQNSHSTLLPPLARPEGSILWRYPLHIQAAQRDALLAYLWEQGVHDATCWYPPLRPMTTTLAPHLSQPFTPVADALGASVINLPLDEHTSLADAQRIAGLITSFLQSSLP